MNTKGWAIWLTGLPASGKSTLATSLARSMAEIGVKIQILESDVLRNILTPNPIYSPEEREIFYSSLVFIGGLLADNGINVVFDATANKRRWRDAAESRFTRFLEIYLDCPIEVCKKRDPKGIYELVKNGKAKYVPGAQQEYEPPLNPEVVLDYKKTPTELFVRVMEELRNRGFI